MTVGKVSTFWHSAPKSCILKKWRGFHFTNVLNFSHMRKIETQMIAAVHGNKNWSSGNTQVVTNDGVSTVYLARQQNRHD